MIIYHTIQPIRNGLEVEKYPAPTRRIYDGPRNVGDCGSHLNRFCFT